ncbi:MAG: M48 family metallopeptidase [Magnetococcales bacterium]|nr:M48 family metallopeptidase [Magnetococcales bacterium]MBF0149625.1 M48 family metallopeptidase [Magnetococcales bacterium]
MNAYAWLILMAIVFGFILEAVATFLNIRHAPATPPEPFQDCFDQDRFLRARDYLAQKAKWALVVAAWDLSLLLLWWWLGGFNLLDQWLRTLLSDELLRGVAYIGILLVAGRILNLPFSIHHVFVIENRFGFNRTTPGTFALDLIKSLILSALLGGLLLWGVLWFFQQAGSLAWLYCWIGVTLFSLGIQYVAPRWIFPLFFHFKPLPEGALRRAVLAYAQKVQVSVREVFEVDGSRRSTKANAFFTGFGKNRRIALFDTLIQSHSEDEVIAVLAHEVGHDRHHHVPKGLAIGIVHMGLLFFLLSVFLKEPELFRAFAMEQGSVYSGLVFFSLLLTPLDLIVGPMFKWYSRKNEFEADRFAVQTAPDPGALIGALKKLAANSLSNLTPHPLHVMLHDTHPPLLQRIQRMEQEWRNLIPT